MVSPEMSKSAEYVAYITGSNGSMTQSTMNHRSILTSLNVFQLQDILLEQVDNKILELAHHEHFDFDEGELVYTERDYALIRTGEGKFYRLFNSRIISIYLNLRYKCYYLPICIFII